MNLDLFRLALDRLQPTEWETFEELASAFLVPDFPQLRTMAHPSGDGGRDSELFQLEGKSFIIFQYSVQKDWKAKIRHTVKRVESEFPDVRFIIFMSNHQIGGQADELKGEMLAKSISLDVRDKNWFLERASSDVVREQAAEHLIDRIARPYLAGEGVIEKPSSALSTNEARAALLYLGLQWQDDITQKGLTKVSFDALIRAALRHTHSENRMSRQQVHESIHLMLPSSQKDGLSEHIESALGRLTKRYIRHWRKEDAFCLTHDEHLRILSKLAEKENEEFIFHTDLIDLCTNCLTEINCFSVDALEDLQNRIPRVIEKFLLRKGETFVSAFVSGNLERIGFEHLQDIVLDDLSRHSPNRSISHKIPNIVTLVIKNLCFKPSQATQAYLRRLADSYTLFSFLRETPDVQSATHKLFSHGTVWLDTTVLLPLFAEQLEADESQRKFSLLFRTCHEAGIELFVTPGVLQEINSHMSIALICSGHSVGAWRGRVPYLYYQYLQTGQHRSEFSKWLKLFRGAERPEEDIAQFLYYEYSIGRHGLLKESEMVNEDLRHAADRLWSAEHAQRRRNNVLMDEASVQQLIKNDLETYLGVIALRQTEQVTELGYRHWLLTLDSIAWRIRDRLRDEFYDKTPTSPLLSLDFLVNNLTFGPNRTNLTRHEEQALPIVLDIEMSESMPQDILQIAEKVRGESEGLPEYVIKRNVRDAIDKAKRHRNMLGTRETNNAHEAGPDVGCDGADTDES